MIKRYKFAYCGDLYFDDSRTVKELIEYAAEKYDYYIPQGIEIATLFQAGHHSANDSGWFTHDVNRKCCDEIENCDHLCFAYYLPGVFYFAEGGWGQRGLGNHPIIPDPVELNLRFEDFDNPVVINGNYCFADVVRFIQMTGYLTPYWNRLCVHLIGTSGGEYWVPVGDSRLQVKLLDLIRMIQEYRELRYGCTYISDEIFEIQ